MDRNTSPPTPRTAISVALRKESVDRNSRLRLVLQQHAQSLSARRAWIEIELLCNDSGDMPSLSARRAWIEIVGTSLSAYIHKSLSARRAWIEMFKIVLYKVACGVALRKESVDRNTRPYSLRYNPLVALRKESVDRNRRRRPLFPNPKKSLSARRAWIEIKSAPQSWRCRRGSLSARRAWIEIEWIKAQYPGCRLSLSARRAWIEI